MNLSTGVVGIPYFEYNQDKHLLLGWFTIWDDFHWRHEFFLCYHWVVHADRCRTVIFSEMTWTVSTLWIFSDCLSFQLIIHSKKMSEHIWTRIRWMNFDVNKIRVRDQQKGDFDILETFFDSFVLGWCIGSTSLLTSAPWLILMSWTRHQNREIHHMGWGEMGQQFSKGGGNMTIARFCLCRLSYEVDFPPFSHSYMV